MEGNIEISLDKLPVKRLDAIEENGLERFPRDVDYDEKRLSLIRRIDFAWAVEKDDEDVDESDEKQGRKKKKTSKDASQPWPWQSLVENLQLAHQELSVIIDLVNTVEANDDVTVAYMTRPKPLPNEALSDLAVSAATKLQCFRHLGKYFKQSAKALEQQIAREARFYGALIRLQQNWKVKRQRLAASASGNEGFCIDLYDNLPNEPAAGLRTSLPMVRVEHDSAGMLAVKLAPNSRRSIHFGFLGTRSGDITGNSNKVNSFSLAERSSRETKKEPGSDDECIKQTHSVLREVHRGIFDEQVFDLVNREAFNTSTGVNVTGIREDYLQLNIGQEASVFAAIVPSGQDDQAADSSGSQNLETEDIPLDTLGGSKLLEGKDVTLLKKEGFPNSLCYKIYLQQIFHEHVFSRAKDRPALGNKAQSYGQGGKNSSGLLGHFCLSLNHRIFSDKVLTVLESLVERVPYLHLKSHPTWHSRRSSWTLSMKVPQSILHSSRQTQTSDAHRISDVIRSQFRTMVVLNDDCISVEGESAPNVVGLFKGNSEDTCSMNKYECDLADLPVILLQQVASQVIGWLHKEALMVGIKANQDYLCLSFELEQGEILGLVAHVDPEDTQGCISWWLVVEDGFTEDRKLNADMLDGGSDYRKFLGYLSLDVLYSTLMDLVNL
ncbi:hypothetical protein RJ641_027010 [Dillenia turbinata]|uniref:Mediator of RNA polymerase II transcription subunit 17 n=1 Tax=Dillenia turbinata TaxID=194707 RepID=A0AAN8VVD1_9MAGN